MKLGLGVLAILGILLGPQDRGPVVIIRAASGYDTRSG